MLKTLNKWIKTSTPWQTILRFLMVLLTTFTSLIVFFSIITFAPPAQAANACVPNLFYASSFGGNTLYTVDITNGNAAVIGNLSEFTTTAAISRDSRSGRIYYVEGFGPADPTRPRIAYYNPIDPTDKGLLSPLPGETLPSSITNTVVKMAQQADTGKMFIVSSNNVITRIDINEETNRFSNPVTIDISSIGIGSGDIAFDPYNSNILYLTRQIPAGAGVPSPVELYRVNISNPASPIVTPIGTTTTSLLSNSLAFSAGPTPRLYLEGFNSALVPQYGLYELSTTPPPPLVPLETLASPIGNGITRLFSDFGTLPNLTPEVATASVAVTKRATDDALLPGGSVTYDIEMVNTGTCNAIGLNLTDNFPPTISNPSWTSSFRLMSDPTQTGKGKITPSGGTGSINAKVNLDVGSKLVITVTGTLNNAVGPYNLSNTVMVTPPAGINLQGTTTATDDTPVLGGNLPNIAIRKEVSPTFSIGNNITYILRVYNEGNGAAMNPVIVNDPTPPGTTFVSSSSNFGTCTAFPCTFDPGLFPALPALSPIPPPNAVVITAVFATSAGTPLRLTNVASVTMEGENGLLLQNNRATATTVAPVPPPSPSPSPPIVPPVVDVAIGVTSPPSVPPGSTFNVTLTARNVGTANADNVTVSYDVPAGVTVVSVPSGCVYDATASTIVCAPIPSFGRGATTSYNFVFKAPDTPISLTGIARISTTSAEPNTGNNSAAATTTVATGAPDPNPPIDPNTGLPIIPIIPTPTPTPSPLIPSVIGTTLQVNNPPTNNRNGTETVQFTVTITNTGTQPLRDLQAIIDLVQTFSGVQGFVVVSVDSSDFVINPAFNGTDLQNLLGAGNILNPGATGRITFRVQVTPGSNTGPYFASVTVRGTDPNGVVVSDVSTDGTIADANGNGTTSDDTTPTVIQFTGLPNIRLVKRMTNAFRNGVAVSGINFNTLINDANDVNDDAPGWANLSPLGLVRIGETGLLQSGDQLEYTVYFLSDGTGTADNFLFCDPTPAGTSFLGDTYGSGLGSLLRLDGVETSQTNALDADAGRFIPPLTPAPSPCPSPNNPNGAVYMQIPRVSNRSPNNVGFVRFRVLLQ